MLPYVVIAVIVIGIVLSIALPRRKRRKLQAGRLERLRDIAPVVDGTVSKDGELVGTYAGRPVTATLLLVDPTPSASVAHNAGTGNRKVEVLRVHVTGDGAAPWHVWPGLNLPFKDRGFTFVDHDGAGQLAQMFTKVDAFRRSPETEEALEAAGLFGLVGALADDATGWHPQVRFNPDVTRLMAARFPPDMPTPPGVGPRPGPKGGFDVQVLRGGDDHPTPETFRHLLDVTMQIAALNEQVNPVPPS